jgi:serine/threonine protein kinase
VARARYATQSRSCYQVLPGSVQRPFPGEANAIAALNHPNICTLFDGGPNYLAMEYVEGAELRGPIPVEKAIELAGQILEALDAAHRKGIVHRDLKPGNNLSASPCSLRRTLIDFETKGSTARF